MQAISVSLSPCELSLVDLVGHVFPGVLQHLWLHLQGKEPNGDLQFRLFPLVTSGSESLPLLPAAGGNLSGDDCTCGQFPHSSLNVERLRFSLQKLAILKFLQVFISLCGSPSCMPPMCPRAHVELRGYWVGLGSLLPSCVHWGQQVPLPSKSSHWPSCES